MKVIYTLTLLVAMSLSTFAQDYMDKIVAKSCDCLTELPDSIGKQEITLKMGLCMIDAAQPYAKQLKKDHGIDFNKIDKGDGERLGRIIGVKLATVCPDALMAVVKKIKPEMLDEDTEIAGGATEGEITKIDSDMFVTYSIKDEDGKTNKYYWITYIENDLDLMENYESMLGKNVYLEYEEQDLFDPKIKEYRKFNVITVFEVL